MKTTVAFHDYFHGRVGDMDKELVTPWLNCQVTLANDHISTSRRDMVTKLESRKVKMEAMGHSLSIRLYEPTVTKRE